MADDNTLDNSSTSVPVVPYRRTKRNNRRKRPSECVDSDHEHDVERRTFSASNSAATISTSNTSTVPAEDSAAASALSIRRATQSQESISELTSADGPARKRQKTVSSSDVNPATITIPSPPPFEFTEPRPPLKPRHNVNDHHHHRHRHPQRQPSSMASQGYPTMVEEQRQSHARHRNRRNTQPHYHQYGHHAAATPRAASMALSSSSSSNYVEADVSVSPPVDDPGSEHVSISTRLRRIQSSVDGRVRLRNAFQTALGVIPEFSSSIFWSHILQPEKYLGGGSYGHVHAYRLRDMALPFSVAIKTIYTSLKQLSDEEKEAQKSPRVMDNDGEQEEDDGDRNVRATVTTTAGGQPSYPLQVHKRMSSMSPNGSSRGRGPLEVPEDIASRMHEIDYDAAMLEIQCQKLVSTLVERKLCPHFPLFVRDAYETSPPRAPSIRSGVGRPRTTASARSQSAQYNMKSIHLVMEMCDESLHMWFVRRHQSSVAIMSMLFQVSAAICWMGATYQMIHNDLFLRNLMCNHVDRRLVHRYHIGNAQFDVPLHGYMWKVVDYSLATSPTMLKRTHMNEFNTGATMVLRTHDFIACSDPAKTYTLPPYVRDILSLLWSIVAQNRHNPLSVPDKIIQWTVSGIQYIESLLQLPTVDFEQSPVDMIRAIIHMFSPDNLAKHGFPPNMYAPSLNVHDGEIPTYVLHVSRQ